MIAALYFLHGEPDDVSYVDSRTPEERANEPEVEFTTTAGVPPEETVMMRTPDETTWWALPEKDKHWVERRRRMPEHWVAREAILFLAGVVVGAFIVAASVAWL
jgi:hypothetical protein